MEDVYPKGGVCNGYILPFLSKTRQDIILLSTIHMKQKETSVRQLLWDFQLPELASAFNLSINNISNSNGNFHHTHLVLYSRVYLSGCSQFKQVETSSSWFDLISVHDSIRDSMALPHHFCFGLQQERLCKTDLSGL